MRLGHRELATYSFAILNPLQLEREQWNDLQTTPLVPAVLSGNADTMPRLLHLAAMTPTQRAVLLARADANDRDNDAPYFTLLLESSVPAEQVAAHLTRRLVVRTPEGDHALLRWYDPRVFQHLHWVLSKIQLSFLSGPIRAWCWRSNSGAWQRHVVAADNLATAWRLTPEQWRTLSRLGVLNRSAAQLVRNAPDIVLDDALYQRIDAALHQAYDVAGLQDEADARQYVEHAVRYPGIHETAAMRQCLAQCQREQTSYVGACMALDIAAVMHAERYSPSICKDAVQ